MESNFLKLLLLVFSRLESLVSCLRIPAVFILSKSLQLKIKDIAFTTFFSSNLPLNLKNTGSRYLPFPELKFSLSLTPQ